MSFSPNRYLNISSLHASLHASLSPSLSHSDGFTIPAQLRSPRTSHLQIHSSFLCSKHIFMIQARPTFHHQTTMDSASGFPGNQGSPQRPSCPADWEIQRENIKLLYVAEHRPLREVVVIMKGRFGFFATYVYAH